jgi:hypothetical protein
VRPPPVACAASDSPEIATTAEPIAPAGSAAVERAKL